MTKYHKTESGSVFAELLPDSDIINTPGDVLDIVVETGYKESSGLIVHAETLNSDFFDLKTGLAGGILQKFSNYRMKLAIVGDFSGYKSKSLQDFIRESNKHGVICFVNTVMEALNRLDK
jgi:hypothetical protein